MLAGWVPAKLVEENVDERRFIRNEWSRTPDKLRYAIAACLLALLLSHPHVDSFFLIRVSVCRSQVDGFG